MCWTLPQSAFFQSRPLRDESLHDFVFRFIRRAYPEKQRSPVADRIFDFDLSGSQFLCSCSLQVNGSRFQNSFCPGGQAIVRRIFKFENSIWAISSAGRAPGSQSGGQGFDPPMVHHWTHIRTLSYVGYGFRPNQKALSTIIGRECLSYCMFCVRLVHVNLSELVRNWDTPLPQPSQKT